MPQNLLFGGKWNTCKHVQALINFSLLYTRINDFKRLRWWLKKEESVGRNRVNRLSFSSNRIKDKGNIKDLAFGKSEKSGIRLNLRK